MQMQYEQSSAHQYTDMIMCTLTANDSNEAQRKAEENVSNFALKSLQPMWLSVAKFIDLFLSVDNYNQKSIIFQSSFYVRRENRSKENKNKNASAKPASVMCTHTVHTSCM